MKIWLRRISALGLISLGIVLIFLPFNDRRSGRIEKEIVSIKKQELLNPDEIRTQFPGHIITDITGPELNPDDYPDLWRAFINLKYYNYPNESSGLEEWNRFQDSVLKGIEKFRLVLFREGLITCSINNSQETVFFKYLGRYNINIKSLSEADLIDYPSLTHLLKILDAGNTADSGLDTMPKDEWDRMSDRYLDSIEDSRTFNFKGNFYGPEFDSDITQIEGSISNLGNILKGIGVLSLVLGFMFVRRLYVRKRGIMVNPQGIALLNDGITLLFAIPSLYMVVTTVLVKTLYIQPLINDNFGIFMGNFFFCVGIPALTLYTSRFTAQSVEIDSKGVHVDSLMGKDFIAWESLESLEFSTEYIVVGRGGILLPRELQKCLTLIGGDEQRLTVNEPQLKSTKGHIILRFNKYAPDRLKDTIKNVLDEW